MLTLIIVFVAIIVVCIAADVWFKYHPLKKADAKTEKYRYKGF